MFEAKSADHNKHNSNHDEEEDILLKDVLLEIDPTGGIIRPKRFAAIRNEDFQLKYYLAELDKNLHSEAEKIFRIPMVIDLFKRCVGSFDISDELFQAVDKALSQNPFRAVIGVGSCFAPDLGHLNFRDYLQDNFHSRVKRKEYSQALESIGYSYRDVDFFAITNNSYQPEERRATLRVFLQNHLAYTTPTVDLHADAIMTESELLDKIEKFRRILEKYTPEQRAYTRNNGLQIPHEVSVTSDNPFEAELNSALDSKHLNDIFFRRRSVVLYQSANIDSRLGEELERLRSDGLLRDYKTYDFETHIPYANKFRGLYPDKFDELMRKVEKEWLATVGAPYLIFGQQT